LQLESDIVWSKIDTRGLVILILNPYLWYSPSFSLSRERKLPVQRNLFSKGSEVKLYHQVVYAPDSFQFTAWSATFFCRLGEWRVFRVKAATWTGYLLNACINNHERQSHFLEVKQPGNLEHYQ
jgi:hypothetical protein